jgi:hypothetical protein
MFILLMTNCCKAKKLYKIKKGFHFNIKTCNNIKILHQKVALSSILTAQGKITQIIRVNAIKVN